MVSYTKNNNRKRRRRRLQDYLNDDNPTNYLKTTIPPPPPHPPPPHPPIMPKLLTGDSSEEYLERPKMLQCKQQQDLTTSSNFEYPQYKHHLTSKRKPIIDNHYIHKRRRRRIVSENFLNLNFEMQSTLFLIIICCLLWMDYNHLFNICNCQQQLNNNQVEFSPPPPPPTQLFNQPSLDMEGRAELMKQPNGINQQQQQQSNNQALSELVNFLSNYAAANRGRQQMINQQQQQLSQNRQSPQQLPNNNNLLQPTNQFLQNLPQNIQNPNLSRVQRPAGIQFPVNQQKPPTQQQQQPQILVSSSPATPVNYLTLSRLASFANNNNNGNNRLSPPQQMNNNNNNNNNIINLNNQRAVAAPIPLGVAPPRGMQPQRVNTPPLQMRPLIPLPVMQQNPGANVIKQSSGGFAPSGPPPSMAASNNAVVVVTSPSDISTSKPALESSETTTQNGEQQRGSTEQPPTSSSTTTTSPTTITTTTEIVAETDSNWNPVMELNKTAQAQEKENGQRKRGQQASSLAPSPDIVTVPPGYNPDNVPQNYDINVSAQMGGSRGGTGSGDPTNGTSQPPSSIVDTPPASSINPTIALQEPTISVAPTAVTTIIWSPPIEEKTTMATTSTSTIQPTKVMAPQEMQQSTAISQPPTRIRDNSFLNDDPVGKQSDLDSSAGASTTAGVVYGKPQTKESKPTAPPAQQNIQPAPVGQATFESSVPAQGRPFIQSVQLDNQVRPFAGGASSGGRNTPFKPSKPLNGNQMSSGMSIGSGFTITSNGSNQSMPTGDIQDYLANQPPILLSNGAGSQIENNNNPPNEPTISAHGGQDPFGPGQASSMKTPTVNTTTSAAPHPPPPQPKIRRPTFKPKPAVPPIRIDSCIVGDDSSCDQGHNERCVTEYGISSCHCKPGFARLSQLRGYCSPISLLQLTMRIERLSDDRKLAYNYTLENPNTEEYQYLEFETVQALASAFQQTSLAKQFMGTKVNKFFERKGKVYVNMSVSFELNNLTRTERIQSVAAQELYKLISSNAGQSASSSSSKRPLGDSTIVLDGAGSKSGETISRLVDVNECASKDLNDCSKFASCVNEFGGYQCHCLAGYEDKHLNWTAPQNVENGQPLEKSKVLGRVCLGCSANYCSNRGECSIMDGKKTCRCRPNFIGARCDIDQEVLTVAVGGSIVGIVILVITFWCLYVFNKRWKREQQKMDAMSATSGLTFNYVNSSTNSLMSPTQLNSKPSGAISSRSMGGGGGHYGQKFGAALAARGANYAGINSAHAHALAQEQQAIIGSTSSSSSAASQPIAAAMYQYAAAAAAAEEAGLLIAPSSSSEQTSPSSNCGGGGAAQNYSRFSMLMPGNAYTLSGHHHHHLLPQQQAHQQPQQYVYAHDNAHRKSSVFAQFNPADYSRTMNTSSGAAATINGGGYDTRRRTLQGAEPNLSKHQQQQLVGYYLSPDMLINSQQQQQQLYASPQRELCIDTSGQLNNVILPDSANLQKSARRHHHHHHHRQHQQQQILSQRARLNRNSSSMYIDPEYEQDG